MWWKSSISRFLRPLRTDGFDFVIDSNNNFIIFHVEFFNIPTRKLSKLFNVINIQNMVYLKWYYESLPFLNTQFCFRAWCWLKFHLFVAYFSSRILSWNKSVRLGGFSLMFVELRPCKTKSSPHVGVDFLRVHSTFHDLRAFRTWVAYA